MARFTTGTGGSITVGTGSTEILKPDGGRQYALIVNDSDTKMYMNMGGSAVVGEGIPLLPNGGAVEITGENLFVGQVNAICSVAGKNITFFYA